MVASDVDSFHETIRQLLGVHEPRLVDCLYRAATETGSARAFLVRLVHDLGPELACTIDDVLGWRIWSAAQCFMERQKRSSADSSSGSVSATTAGSKRWRRSRWQVDNASQDVQSESHRSFSGIDRPGCVQRLAADTLRIVPSPVALSKDPSLKHASGLTCAYKDTYSVSRDSPVEVFWEQASLAGSSLEAAPWNLAPFLMQLGTLPGHEASAHDQLKLDKTDALRIMQKCSKSTVPKLWRSAGELARSARNASDLLLRWLRHGGAATTSILASQGTLDERMAETPSKVMSLPVLAKTESSPPREALEHELAASNHHDVGDPHERRNTAQLTNSDGARPQVESRQDALLRSTAHERAQWIPPKETDGSPKRRRSPLNQRPVRCQVMRSATATALPVSGLVHKSLGETSARSPSSVPFSADPATSEASSARQQQGPLSSQQSACSPTMDPEVPRMLPSTTACPTEKSYRPAGPEMFPQETIHVARSARTQAVSAEQWRSSPMARADASCVTSGEAALYQTRPMHRIDWPDATASLPLLPIARCRDMLVDLVARFPVVIVVGETGSGKSTQIPQYLWRAGWTRRQPQDAGMNDALLGRWIGCTQPRRIATTRLAKRVASEMGCHVGGLVGYSIRFDDRTTAATQVKYLTDGVLLREAASDPTLSAYSVLIIDEAHERSLNTDLLLAILKRRFGGNTAETPSDGSASLATHQRLIIASATLDAGRFTTFFPGAPILTVPGRCFSVDVLWRPLPRWRSLDRPGGGHALKTDYLEAVIQLALEIHLKEADGDILAFLTGQDDVDAAVAIISERWAALERAQHPCTGQQRLLVACALYASMSVSRQQRALERAAPGTRKCIFATNVAETSLTIDGIRYVIDAGLAKHKIYLPNGIAGIERLVLGPISQAAARQRAGRAGRTAPGRCFRLYSREAWDHEMLPHSIPEISRTDLSQLVLRLLHIGVLERAQDLLEQHQQHPPPLTFLDPPPTPALVVAMQHLWTLSALDGVTGRLTTVGRRLALLPLEPRLGRFLLASIDLGCLEEVLTIVAMLSVGAGETSAGGDVLIRPKDSLERLAAERAHQQFVCSAGDIYTLLRVYVAWATSGYSSEWCDTNFVQSRALARARVIRQQLERLIRQQHWSAGQAVSSSSQFVSSISPDLENRVSLAFLAGFFANIAEQTWVQGQGSYRVVFGAQRGQSTSASRSRSKSNLPLLASIHPSSALYGTSPRLLAYAELVETQKLYLRCCVPIPDRRLLHLVAPLVFR